jgi:hypothetical protein
VLIWRERYLPKVAGRTYSCRKLLAVRRYE